MEGGGGFRELESEGRKVLEKFEGVYYWFEAKGRERKGTIALKRKEKVNRQK